MSDFVGHCPICGVKLQLKTNELVECPNGDYSAKVDEFNSLWNAFDRKHRELGEKIFDGDHAKNLLKDLRHLNLRKR